MLHRLRARAGLRLPPPPPRRWPPTACRTGWRALLGAQIDSGALRPGDRLPTEQQLALAHGVSRTVVREAVHQLKSRDAGALAPGLGRVRRADAAQPAAGLRSDGARVGAGGGACGRGAPRARRRDRRAGRRARHARAGRGAAPRAEGDRRGRGRRAATASPKTWPSTACIGEATGNPQFRLLLGFLEQYLREGMRITRGNEARRADFMEAVQRRAPRHRRRHRGARPGRRAAQRHAAPDPRRAAAGRRRHHLRRARRAAHGPARQPRRQTACKAPRRPP